MAISAINSVSKAITAPVSFQKAVPQPKMVQGLAKDTFQRSTTVTNPIATYTPGIEILSKLNRGGGKKKPRKPEFTPEIQVKINTAKENMINTVGKGNIKSLTFEKDMYTPKDSYILKADLKDFSSKSEYYDKDMNKTGEEKSYVYESKGKMYMIIKAEDYRNNTTTKVRNEIDKEGYPLVTDEVRIVRDKQNNIVRKEYMTHSEITGAYDQKYVYPNGTEKVISKTKVFKNNDNMQCIHKDMESLDGTKTKYILEQDDKGNKILEYKITDKDGNVLMNLNKTMERVGDNKIISSNGDKVWEMTFDPHQVTIQERGKEEKTTIVFDKSGAANLKETKDGFRITGDKKSMVNLMKKMPAEQILALTDTVKNLKGIKDTNDCCMFPDKKQIDTIDDLFSVLHEGGHAIDFRKSKSYMEVQSLTTDKELQKIYSEEKDAYNKAFPNPQRDHVGYFIQIKDHYAGKWGGLGEVVAESNALRDSYTTEEILAPRVQYLQQYYPKTIAYLNTKLSNYKQEDMAAKKV